ncbi:Sulfite reductase subunit alpha [Hyphomicrobium sp. 1Nfss2.1]|uniref:sulfite reductase subunit alpha n=1 Tax=Hyphomicrobium sp. 1Nfss2.1 TaxID=3413936 RepID=UPI003C7C5829
MRRLPAAAAVIATWVSGAHAWTVDGVTADPQRLVAAMAVVLLYVAASVLLSMRHAATKRVADGLSGTDGAAGSVLVAYASQTGYAEQIANSTTRALSAANVPSRMISFADLDDEALRKAQIALFVVSTTGEGDPPDPAVRFVRSVMRSPVVAPGLRYGVLALGDRSFTRFCAFGDAVDTWLAERDATRMFDAIRVNNGDPDTLAQWWQRVGEITGSVVEVDPQPATSAWMLATRRAANPNNPEHAAFHVMLRPKDAVQTWEAGDVAVIEVRNDPAEVAVLLGELGLEGTLQIESGGCVLTLSEHLMMRELPQSDVEMVALSRMSPALLLKSLKLLRPREYSIASLPADGGIELLVRQARRPNGRLGVGSGWLTQHAGVGDTIELSVRANSAFRAPTSDRPMILIGNGTGVAGLRAHLKARAEAGAMRNWLFFGERTAADDLFYRDDIAKWRVARVLGRCDFAFSRDGEQRSYVQDCVRRRADDVRAWIADGAAIYVCGSLQGMSGAVNDVLGEIVGAQVLQELVETGRYRRDVY